MTAAFTPVPRFRSVDFECRSESNQRQIRYGWGQRPRKTQQPPDRVVSRRDRRAVVCARGDEPRATIPAAGYAALGRGPRNPRTLITGSGARGANSVSDGVVCGSLPSGEIEPAVTLASPPSESSSGDGLGIHQPRSMPRGFASLRQPASGRARKRAMCPAVARAFGRAR